MSSALTRVGELSPTADTARRVADIVAALTPPARTPDAGGEKPAPAKVPWMAIAPRVGGAVAGSLLWPSHRVHGALLGNAVAAAAMPVLHGGADRKKALWWLGVEGAGVAASLYSKQHPVLGWAGGVLAALAASALVPGSPANDWWKSRK